jgi:hypothetical protein
MTNNDYPSPGWGADAPEWFAEQLRIAHLHRYSASPVWQRARVPDRVKLARELGRFLADHALRRRSVHPAEKEKP